MDKEERDLVLFEEFRKDFEEYREAMLDFIKQYPEFEFVRRWVKSAKHQTPMDKTSLDYILGVKKK